MGMRVWPPVPSLHSPAGVLAVGPPVTTDAVSAAPWVLPFRDPRCPGRQGPAPKGCPPACSLEPQREGPWRCIPVSAGALGHSLTLATSTP